MDFDNGARFAIVANDNADFELTTIRYIIDITKQLPTSIESCQHKSKICKIANVIKFIAAQIPDYSIEGAPALQFCHQASSGIGQTSTVETKSNLSVSDYPTVLTLAQNVIAKFEYAARGVNSSQFDLYHLSRSIIEFAHYATDCCGGDAGKENIASSPITANDAGAVLMNIANGKDGVPIAPIMNAHCSDVTAPPPRVGAASDDVLVGSASDEEDGQGFIAWFRHDYAMRLTQKHQQGDKNAIFACFYGIDKLCSEVTSKEMNACRAKRHRKKKVMEEQIKKLQAGMGSVCELECEVWVGDIDSGGFINMEQMTCRSQVREMGSPGCSGTFFDGFIMKSWAGLDAIESSRKKVSVPCTVRGYEGQWKRLTGEISEKILVTRPVDNDTRGGNIQRMWVEHYNVLDSTEMIVDG